MLTKVTKFKFEHDYVLWVQFDDGSSGTHDFSELVARPGTMIAPLKDPEYFRRAFLEFSALTWPNGFDIAPEWLRREMEQARELQHVEAA